MNSELFLRELKSRNDIADMISNYTKLHRSGRNSVGLCPFHNEKTPSFTVYSDSQSFYCFGCGKGGDIITFTMLAENLDYLDALKYLAQKSGIEMPALDIDDKAAKLKAKILEINRFAARFFYTMLYSSQGEKALKYLLKRGLSEKTIKHFGLGFSPMNKNLLTERLKAKGFSEYEIERANLAYKNRKGTLSDRFFNRIMFPIIDVRGNVIAFGARTMGNNQPKYLNTSDTLVFRKSDNLFSLNFAKNSKTDRFILAEGYMDVIALNQIGFIETVASLGTSLTNIQARLISRYTKEVIIAYDADVAGQKATMRAIPILRNEGLNIRVLKIPSGKDPDEFIRTTKDADIKIKNILEKSQSDINFRIEKIKQQYDLSSTQGRVDFITKICNLFATLENSVERDIYISKLSQDENIDKRILSEQINKIMKKRKKSYKNKSISIPTYTNQNNDAEIAENKKISSMEENIIAFVINNPDSADNIMRKLNDDYTDYIVNKKFFDFIFLKLKTTQSLSFSDFSGHFSVDEMSFLARILATKGNNIRTNEQLYEYTDILCCEYKKKKIRDNDISSDEDLKEFISMLKKQKQKTCKFI